MGVIGLMLHMQYGLVYLCQLLPFLVCCDIRSSFEGLCPLSWRFCFYFFEEKKYTLGKLFTLRLMGVKLPEN